MKIKLWVYMANQGDGSARAQFFRTEKAAEKEAEKDYERFCDDVYPEVIDVTQFEEITNEN